MGPLLAFSRGVDRLNAAVGKLADWAVLLSCAISAGNAFVRYGISYSSNAWLEVQWYLFGATVMLGASYTLFRNEHVRVDLLYSSLSERARLWVDVFGFIFFTKLLFKCFSLLFALRILQPHKGKFFHAWCIRRLSRFFGW